MLGVMIEVISSNKLTYLDKRNLESDKIIMKLNFIAQTSSYLVAEVTTKPCDRVILFYFIQLHRQGNAGRMSGITPSAPQLTLARSGHFS